MSRKIRVLPTLLYKDTELVKGKGFDSWRNIGSAMQSIKVFNLREVDELIFVDITATAQGRRPDFALIDDLADDCFMPLTVGGGVTSVDDVRQLLQVGADKVVLNSIIYTNPELISQVSDRFGAQCVVVSIDAKKVDDHYECFSHSGKTPTGKDPVDTAKDAEVRGAGEILITSIERDGFMEGYDIELTKLVSQAVSIPVIASGGAGSYQDMVDVLKGSKASAVAAASIYQFTQQTPLEAKKYLDAAGFPVRL
ncbi:MAG: imidazole glycerol phosphate synthase subunit HisF [Flammeovirgaceae bacterium]|nr:imidazole glycerol phosphate synthase subunit HisF [Flammeovirgaceae bacterium]